MASPMSLVVCPGVAAFGPSTTSICHDEPLAAACRRFAFPSTYQACSMPLTTTLLTRSLMSDDVRPDPDAPGPSTTSNCHKAPLKDAWRKAPLPSTYQAWG